MANPGMRHAYKSAKSDPVDTTLVGATKWNDRHYFLEDDGSTASGTLGDLPYRGASGLITLLTGASGVLTSAGSGNIPAWSMTPTLTGLTVTTITIGAVTLDATDAGYIDGLTAGTVTASKALVVDANKDIATLRNITLSGNLVVGATTISETDIAKIDAITNGAGAASKALVLDASADITSGLRDVTMRQLNAQFGGMTLLLGADSAAITRTDATQKFTRIGSAHYTNSEEPLAIILADSNNTNSGLSIGGGSASFNAATQLDFYTAATTTTTTGTMRWRINNSGHLLGGADNTYDIGASGATRPRNIYVAGLLTLSGGTLLATSAALTNGAAANTGTLTNAPAVGNPTKWIPINDNGTTRYVPAW